DPAGRLEPECIGGRSRKPLRPGHPAAPHHLGARDDPAASAEGRGRRSKYRFHPSALLPSRRGTQRAGMAEAVPRGAVNMHIPPLNTRDAQDIAKRSGNDKLVFWTSVASLGFMGVMAATATANMVFNMVRRGQYGHLDEPRHEGGRERYRGR